MIGVFIQVNESSRKAKCNPIGYILQESGCWDWVGSKENGGYGHLYAGGKFISAHRWMYERDVGPIPEGKECHHVCANRGCVNPDHLEIVTRGEHMVRDEAYTAYRSRRTHCRKGHPYSGENLHIASSNGARVCRACRAAAGRRYRARQRANQLSSR